MNIHLVIETVYGNNFTDSDIVFGSLSEIKAKEKRDELEQKNRVVLKKYSHEYTLSSVDVDVTELAFLRARVEELGFLLLRCQQMNYTADGEDAALWNINGKFEQCINAALAKGAK